MHATTHALMLTKRATPLSSIKSPSANGAKYSPRVLFLATRPEARAEIIHYCVSG